MNFNERLIQLRNKKGLTQSQMAEVLDVKRARYNAWEQALSQPGIEMINKIASFHKVSTDYLIGRSEMTNAEIDRKYTMDSDIRVIQRAATQMSPEQRKEAIKMWDFLFKDLVTKAKREEGVDGNGEEEEEN